MRPATSGRTARHSPLFVRSSDSNFRSRSNCSVQRINVTSTSPVPPQASHSIQPSSQSPQPHATYRRVLRLDLDRRSAFAVSCWCQARRALRRTSRLPRHGHGPHPFSVIANRVLTSSAASAQYPTTAFQRAACAAWMCLRAHRAQVMYFSGQPRSTTRPQCGQWVTLRRSRYRFMCPLSSPSPTPVRLSLPRTGCNEGASGSRRSVDTPAADRPGPTGSSVSRHPGQCRSDLRAGRSPATPGTM